MGAAAEKIIDGEWLTESEIAKRVGLHRQTVAARLDDLGYEADEDRSKPKANVHWFDSEMEFALKAAKDTVSAVKIRDLRAAAQLKELKLAKERGDLVPMADAVDDLQKVLSWLYQEFTVRQVKRIGPKLAKAKTAAQIKQLLKSDADKIMKNLKANFEGIVG